MMSMPRGAKVKIRARVSHGFGLEWFISFTAVVRDEFNDYLVEIEMPTGVRFLARRSEIIEILS